MESTLPVIEVVTFRANAKCLGDPGLFKEVRDMAAATTTVNTMYWGRSVEVPSVFFWLLLWDSLAQSKMREGTASHAELVSRLDALVDDPSRKRVYHIHFPEHPPLSCIEAPVTMFILADLRDIQYVDMWNRLAGSLVSNFNAVSAKGHLDGVCANPLEDAQVVVILSAWESIELHLKFGTEECHQKVIQEIEEFITYLKDLHMHHVHFEQHA
ncbi:hypothetical protein BJV78DRAFT_697108 [Lactifluus subvellereus]|nr:hypothetical protein BJV78DRAFT_697108 [Lactifluus subvellereus]